MGHWRRLCWVEAEMVSRRWHAHPLLLPLRFLPRPTSPEIPPGRSQDS